MVLAAMMEEGDEISTAQNPKYREANRQAKEKQYCFLIHHSFIVQTKNKQVWKFVSGSSTNNYGKEAPDNDKDRQEKDKPSKKDVGVKGFQFTRFDAADKSEDPHTFIDLFAFLCPGDWRVQLTKMNKNLTKNHLISGSWSQISLTH